MNWKEFNSAAPEVARAGKDLIDQAGVVLVGTLRKDGSPRISPVEALIAGDHLYIGMMPDTFKVQDLLRDRRCTVHNLISNRYAPEGEFKLHGLAINVHDPDQRKFFCDEARKRTGWSPEALPFQLFTVDIQSAGMFSHDGGKRILRRWRVGDDVKAFKQGMRGKLTPVSVRPSRRKTQKRA